MASQTTAQRISAIFDNNGLCCTSPAGEDFTDICKSERRVDIDQHQARESTRYTFEDGSVLVETGECWDFGYVDCHCHAFSGHAKPGDCEADKTEGSEEYDGSRVTSARIVYQVAYELGGRGSCHSTLAAAGRAADRARKSARDGGDYQGIGVVAIEPGGDERPLDESELIELIGAIS